APAAHARDGVHRPGRPPEAADPHLRQAGRATRDLPGAGRRADQRRGLRARPRLGRARRDADDARRGGWRGRARHCAARGAGLRRRGGAGDRRMTAALGSLLVEPVPRLVGHVAVPGDKSISRRSVLIGAICDGETHVTGFGRSADTEATIAAVRALGVDVYEHGADTLRVFGKGLRGLRGPARPSDCANAGTLVRLIAGILAGQDGERFELTGDESLSRRPMGRIAVPRARMDARVEPTEGGLPLRIEGSALTPLRYELPVASAQVKSCVLLAGL